MVNKWIKKRSVMRRYNLTSQIYDERYGEEQAAKYASALEGLKIESDSLALDVGCGSGLFFESVASLAKTVVGVDISKELLLLAMKHQKKFDNVLLVLADADYLPFRQNIFDFVFAFTILQNLPRPSVTLREFKYSAKIHACFVVTGLKAAIPLETLGILVDSAGLRIVAFKENEKLRCNIVTCTRS